MKMKDQTQITNNSFSKGYGIETGSPLRIPFDVAVLAKNMWRFAMNGLKQSTVN